MPNHVHSLIKINSDLVTDISIKIKSLSELMGAYKTTTSKQIHLIGNDKFAWQRSFHDHIIRGDSAYEIEMNNLTRNRPSVVARIMCSYLLAVRLICY